MRHEATRLLGQAIFGVLSDFWEQEECKVAVCDDAGLILFEVQAFAVASPALWSRQDSDVSPLEPTAHSSRAA